jgi:hypothetical protein
MEIQAVQEESVQADYDERRPSQNLLMLVRVNKEWYVVLAFASSCFIIGAGALIACMRRECFSC